MSISLVIPVQLETLTLVSEYVAKILSALLKCGKLDLQLARVKAL
jgi:hypothetical protein